MSWTVGYAEAGGDRVRTALLRLHIGRAIVDGIVVNFVASVYAMLSVGPV